MDDTDVDTTDVAALMGFGSFGDQKKRKHDLVSDDANSSTREASNGNAPSYQPPGQFVPDRSTRDHQPHASRGGEKNDNGDMAYFLPSFIEDPWKHLLDKRKS